MRCIEFLLRGRSGLVDKRTEGCQSYNNAGYVDATHMPQTIASTL